mmetsp:Transcript_24824/g.37099  ORF Transcript_24824/g.37099 Transcript_24824/m.37099 type:complete len:556 (-) Transcript_24824:651-2318(-)
MKTHVNPLEVKNDVETPPEENIESNSNASLRQNIKPASNQGYAIVKVVQTKNKKLEERKIILQPMTVDFPAGCITAILGPSGCGKTTMLDFITGNISSSVKVQGEVSLPGTNAYIPQDDRLHGFYTCYTYMKHYARLSGKKNNSETETDINNILESLGLAEHKHTIVGDIFLKGLSGGQKRRLSIALEALSKPRNFFLDEPTSGLDAESAFQVMKFLRAYTRAYPCRRVVLTIHQPSSFIWQLIDNVVLLAKGRVIYQGPRSVMESFFASEGQSTPKDYNPADHYVTVVNDDFAMHEKTTEDWERAFLLWSVNKEREKNQRSSTQSTETSNAPVLHDSIQQTEDSLRRLSLSERQDCVSTNRAGGAWTALELTRRYFLNLLFNPGILGTRIAMYVLLSLVIGALFWELGDKTSYESIQSRIALAFYCVAFFVFMSIAVLPFTVIERAIVEKEVRNGYYHPAIYQFAQGISSIPATALLAFLTTLIILSMTKLNEPYWYFLNMFLALSCAEALAQFVSHLVPHFIIGMAIVAGVSCKYAYHITDVMILLFACCQQH